MVELIITRNQDQTPVKCVGILCEWMRRYYLFCSADTLTKSDWSDVSQVQVISQESPWFSVNGPPPIIGIHVQDNQPNMFSNPDMGEGIVAWPLDRQRADHCLKLRESNCKAGQPLWLVTPTRTGFDLKRCRTVDCVNKMIVVEPVDRFLMEDYLGCPLVDQHGELVGNHLGCSQVVITGASSVAIGNKLR